jgi:hypothetical protein
LWPDITRAQVFFAADMEKDGGAEDFVKLIIQLAAE